MKTKHRHCYTNGNGSGILALTRRQILSRLERGAQERLNLSARELVLRHRKNRLKDPGRVADLLALSYLLPENDPAFRARAHEKI